MTQYIRYGIQNGDIKNIEEVESGLNCNCVCASCGGVLIARKGEKKVHHFAHYNSEDCVTGYQTSIHLMAKDIISERKWIRLPNGELVKADKVELEKRVCDVIPDIVVWINNIPLMIEIYVTHKVDEEKANKIKELEISCIEIDLHNVNYDINKEILSSIMLNEKRCYWIFNRVEYFKAKHYKTFLSTNIKKFPRVKFTKYGTVWCDVCKAYITRDFCGTCMANSGIVISGINYTLGKDNKKYYECKTEEDNYCLSNFNLIKDKLTEYLDVSEYELSVAKKNAKKIYAKQIVRR